MAAFKKNPLALFIHRLGSFAAAAIFMAPSVSSAEPLLLLHDAAYSRPVPEIVVQTARRPVDICLNESGDLVIRRGGVSLTMAYSAPDEVIEPQERTRIAQRQNCPSISGVSLKVSFLF